MKEQHINIRVTEKQKDRINRLKGEKTITQFLMMLVEDYENYAFLSRCYERERKAR